MLQRETRGVGDADAGGSAGPVQPRKPSEALSAAEGHLLVMSMVASSERPQQHIAKVLFT